MEENRLLQHRRTVDHGNNYARQAVERRLRRPYNVRRVRPQASYINELLPPGAYKSDHSGAVSSLPTKFVHTSINKIKHPVLTITWTPEGRRLLAGSMSGEFTLWSGMTFSFETIMQAHEQPIRALKYSHSGDWLLSGDHEGTLKYWQPNFNNVHIVSAHTEVIRDIAFSPNDSKFVTASDDGSLGVWSFNASAQETKLQGHGWDVKSCDWHPTLGLVASGSKDNLVKLWDPRGAGPCVATLHGFKNTVSMTRFQPGGSQRLLASASRDHTARLLDLRMLRDMAVLRGHDSDVSSLAWHPQYSNLLSTGGQDGAVNHYYCDTVVPDYSSGISPAHRIPSAHDWPIWTMAYHPVGHVLATGSNDKMIRFWCRSRPGDPVPFDDLYYKVKDPLPVAMGRKIPGHQQMQWPNGRGPNQPQQSQYQQQQYQQRQPEPAPLPVGIQGALASIPGLSMSH